MEKSYSYGFRIRRRRALQFAYSYGKNGIWNYTFDIVEEVDKDKLSEREKFYIDFYDTVNYGLNQKRG